MELNRLGLVIHFFINWTFVSNEILLRIMVVFYSSNNSLNKQWPSLTDFKGHHCLLITFCSFPPDVPQIKTSSKTVTHTGRTLSSSECNIFFPFNPEMSLLWRRIIQPASSHFLPYMCVCVCVCEAGYILIPASLCVGSETENPKVIWSTKAMSL